MCVCVCVCIGAVLGEDWRQECAAGREDNFSRGSESVCVCGGGGVIQDSDRTEQWGTCFQNCQP